jgi:hypothetical protein
MITIYDKNNKAYIIRPCPLINITWNTNFAGDRPIGGKYDITLTGTLLDNGGSPIFKYNDRNNEDLGTSWTSSYYPAGDYTKPLPEQFDPNGALNAILAKQVALRELFSKNCLLIEIASIIPGDSEEIISFYPRFLSINFTEGVWVHKCDYTINLEADFLLDKSKNLIGAENYASEQALRKFPQTNISSGQTNISLKDFLKYNGGMIDDFQESWSIEPEDGNGNTGDPYISENITKIYRLTRNISAKGKALPFCAVLDNPEDVLQYKSYEQARRYVREYVNGSGTALNHYDDYPGVAPYTVAPHNYFVNFANGALNLSARNYGGYNHSRSENIDVAQGTYSLQDTWILSSGTSYENYTLSLSSAQEQPRNKVTIEGNIKGLTSIPASGSVFGGDGVAFLANTSYENAINKYRQITDSGRFGIVAHTYKRAQNAAGGIRLNHIPLSVSVGTNEFTGEINYSIEYDDRPYNIISGVLSENISITDTYPGDVFAVIPVIGRPTGPVLQYIGGRTEYQRSLSLDILVNTSVSGAVQLLLQKPSLLEPTRNGIIHIINACSPGREPGIRKYFASAPQETWDPKEGRYTLNITWTYELNY